MTPEKQLLLDEIKEDIDHSNGMIVTGFKSMTPQNSWDFFEKLSKIEGKYRVVKKRVFQKAAETAGITINLTDYKDHVGVVYVGGDTVSAAKAVYSFADETKVPLKVLCGTFEGKMYTTDEVEQLSKLPTKDEMRAQFIGLLEAPMSQTLSVMEGLMTSIMHAMDNKSKKETS